MNFPEKLLSFNSSLQKEGPSMAVGEELRPSWSDRLRFLALIPRDLLLLLVSLSYRSFLWSFQLLAPFFYLLSFPKAARTPRSTGRTLESEPPRAGWPVGSVD